MPVEILSASLRREWERFPEEIDEAALSAFFSLPDDELERIAGHRSVHGRFAIAVSVGALRWLGFVPGALGELPEPAAALVASQLDIDLSSIDPDRLNVERDARGQQLAQALTISGFRMCRDRDLSELGSWVADRALGHDGPLALLRSAVEELRRRRLMRPGLTVLERLVAAARSQAEREIHRRATPVLTQALQEALDDLLDVPASATAAPVKQLGKETRTVREIGEAIEKLELLRQLGADGWDLGMIPANRRRLLAQYVRHATSQAIGRRDPAFRYPALLSFCAEAVARVTDEITDLFEDGVAAQHAKARRALVARKLSVADSANASVVLLGELLEVLLDPEIPDPKVRQAVWQRATPEELQRALELAAEIKRPLEDSHLEQLGERYRATREFSPRVLEILRLRANPDGVKLLEAVDVLRELAREIANELPVIDLPDLLIEVNRWCNFMRHLTHAGGATPRREDHLRHLFAAIIAQACNLGTGRMARASGLSPAQVGWTSEWYLRHDTLEPATGAIVDYQSTIGLAQRMGSGEHSSSDGKRRIVSPDSQQARALPRYFGRDRGLTHYTFVSDQHTHFATRVIRTTVRDATYVLDGILDNPSQLPIRIHSTDTAGYSDIIFALFDLLGLSFAPRLAGLPDTRLWGGWPAHDSTAGRLLRHRVGLALIREQWDEILRLTGSLREGTVSASLLVARLHAQQRRSTVAGALQDYGRLVKTEFILRYLTRPPERRGINRQLNKHESINALEDSVFYGNEGRIRLQTLDRQSMQAAALGLVSAAITTWNTHQMNAIIARKRAAGRELEDLSLGRLSPAIHAHINLNGRYHIHPDQPPRHLAPHRDALATYH